MALEDLTRSGPHRRSGLTAAHAGWVRQDQRPASLSDQRRPVKVGEKPRLLNTDQGSQFTSAAFTGLLTDNGIAISMDGKGAWRDNVFVERLWRSVKYEEVYLKAYDSVAEARASIGRYLEFYNRKRPHSSLGARTPDQAYFDRQPQALAA